MILVLPVGIAAQARAEAQERQRLQLGLQRELTERLRVYPDRQKNGNRLVNTHKRSQIKLFFLNCGSGQVWGRDFCPQRLRTNQSGKSNINCLRHFFYITPRKPNPKHKKQKKTFGLPEPESKGHNNLTA